VLTDESAKYPPLLGTGGNEGSGSYMSNFCQLVVSLLVDGESADGVHAALFGTPAPILADVTVGQFSPGALNGPNSTVGFRRSGEKSKANPWDLLLGIEGTLLFAGAAARRIGTDTQGKAAFPFTVDPNPVGYGSAAEGEDVRAEIWVPEWIRPTTLGELTLLLAEGRAQLGRRQARTAVDFARAAVTLGVSSGLGAFHRYGVVKRNGLSYFAAYLGRFPVRTMPRARLLDQLDPWLAPLRRLAGDDKAPPRFAIAVRRIDAAMLAACRYGADEERMQAVLRAAGRAEAELANGAKVRADFPGLRPLAGLSADWLKASNDGSLEFRLAASLSFLPGVRDRHRPFRMYLEPVVPVGKRNWAFDAAAPGVVWSNTELPSNLGAVLVRRLRDAGGESTEGIGEGPQHPLWSPGRFRPRLADVLAFLGGETDDQKLAELLWALTAVSPKAPGFRFRKPRPAPGPQVPTDYAVLKLIFLDSPAIRPGTTAPVPIGNEPQTLTLLRAGRLDEAVEVACRRLQVSGFPTYLAGPVAGRVKRIGGFPRDPERTRRLLAALLFPLRDREVERLLELTVRKLEAPTL
jgi:CRISPR-associated protein Csx17